MYLIYFYLQLPFISPYYFLRPLHEVKRTSAALALSSTDFFVSDKLPLMFDRPVKLSQRGSFRTRQAHRLCIRIPWRMPIPLSPEMTDERQLNQLEFRCQEFEAQFASDCYWRERVGFPPTAFSGIRCYHIHGDTIGIGQK